MKLPPEADPNFWIGAKCVAIRVSHFISGAVLRRFVLASAAGAKTHGAPFSVQDYALALARVRRKRRATEAMRKVAQYVAQVDQQVAALLPAAEQHGLDLFRRRRAREDQRTNARRRERLIEEIRRNADVMSEEDVVTAWREGVVEAVHRR